jgi:hypothetical protein
MINSPLSTPMLIGVTGCGLSWLVVNLLGITRTPRSGIGWYRLISAVEAATAVYAGYRLHTLVWITLGLVWAVVKLWWVPAVLSRGLPGLAYGAQARGTPGLIGGSLALAAIVTWTLGPPGVLLAALLTPFWILTQRREVWVQVLLLLEAELVVGFTAIAIGRGAGLADFLAVAELLGLSVLLAWLHVRGSADTVPVPTTRDLEELRG